MRTEVATIRGTVRTALAAACDSDLWFTTAGDAEWFAQSVEYYVACPVRSRCRSGLRAGSELAERDGDQAIGGPRPTLHHANRQSSIRNRQSQAVYEYDVYGQVAAADPNHPNRFLFTGREFGKETGLYYYRARQCNPTLACFLQIDPLAYADGMNQYLYCHNNPGNLIDPYGTFAFPDFCDVCDIAKYLYNILTGNSPYSTPDDTADADETGDKDADKDPDDDSDDGMPGDAGDYTGGGPSGAGAAGAGPTSGAPLGLGSGGMSEEEANTYLSGEFSLPQAPRPGLRFGSHHSPQKWRNEMRNRGWSREQIWEAVSCGERSIAENKVHPGNPATRYKHPETGRSVVVDDVTNEILQIAGDGYKW